MVDLRRTAAEMAEEKAELSSGGEQRPYSWGLELRLETEELDKLKLSGLSVGNEVSFNAKAVVVGVRENETESGAERCVTLQIQEMEFPNRDNTDDVAKRMYEGS